MKTLRESKENPSSFEWRERLNQIVKTNTGLWEHLHTCGSVGGANTMANRLRHKKVPAPEGFEFKALGNQVMVRRAA
jgi:hypothetical protein